MPQDLPDFTGSLMMARMRIGKPHRLQINGLTSYTLAINLAQVERLSLSETEQGVSSGQGTSSIFAQFYYGSIDLRLLAIS